MSESESHKRAKAKAKAAGKSGNTEVKLGGSKRLDAATKKTATEIGFRARFPRGFHMLQQTQKRKAREVQQWQD
jgi:hypothetical protein